MIVPFYLRCVNYGKLKKNLEDNRPLLRFLLMFHLLNRLCLPILSHSKDSWLPNHLMDRWPLNLPLLVPLITRFS